MGIGGKRGGAHIRGEGNSMIKLSANTWMHPDAEGSHRWMVESAVEKFTLKTKNGK